MGWPAIVAVLLWWVLFWVRAVLLVVIWLLVVWLLRRGGLPGIDFH